ncbi:MAG: hypothetical protein ABR511_08115 [Acidimicrobiales bacterium]
MALAVPRTDLAEVAARARPVVLATHRLLPVAPALRPLLPEGGLRRGSVVAVAGSTSLALALVASASAAGSWCAAVAVGRPSVHPEAAAELGVVLERFPLVAAGPGAGPGGWAWVVAALLDAVDVVVAWPPAAVRPTDARRLAARARERGAVLVVPGPAAAATWDAGRGWATGGGPGPESAAAGAGRAGRRGGGREWPEAVDVRLAAVAAAWDGIGRGHGHLAARRLEVVASGRRAAARERRAVVWLPAPGGGVAPAGDLAPAGETTPSFVTRTREVVG